MLFQPTVLHCRFSTSSHQPAVVQWKFKSYCQDRMGESLGMSSPRTQSLSKRNLEWDPYLDCLDSRRTVRVVASKQGSTVTLGDFYRGREITIVHGNNASVFMSISHYVLPQWFCHHLGLYHCFLACGQNFILLVPTLSPSPSTSTTNQPMAAARSANRR